MEYQAVLLEKLRSLYPSGYNHTTWAPDPTPTPDLETLSTRCLNWITNQEQAILQDTSIIALLTSRHFAAALHGHTHPSLTSTLQDFLFSTTLAYTSWRDHPSNNIPPPHRLSVHDMHRISHLTGSALLHQLDHALSCIHPGSPAGQPPRPTLQALFLVVFGTTLGVAYSTPAPVGSGPQVIRTDPLGRVLRDTPAQWAATREHLCHHLADALAALALALAGTPPVLQPQSHLQFDPRLVRDSVVEGCLMGRWNRTGSWVWASPRRRHPFRPGWRAGGAGGGPEGGGAFVPQPHMQPQPQVTRLACPEVSCPMFPRMEGSDAGRRRSMIIVGPSWDGRQVYARVRTHTGSDGPPLFV